MRVPPIRRNSEALYLLTHRAVGPRLPSAVSVQYVRLQSVLPAQCSRNVQRTQWQALPESLLAYPVSWELRGTHGETLVP